MTKRVWMALLGLLLGWRVILGGLAVVAGQLLPYQPSFPYYETFAPKYQLPAWLYSWANFDGVHYLTIIEKGYQGTGLIQAFFPGYPLIVVALTNLIPNQLVAGLVVSHLALVAAVVIWFLLVKKLYDEHVSWLSLLVVLSFPTSFYFGALYSESLFLLCVVSAFWAAVHKKWWLAALATMVASATRVVGVFLIPALLIELWWQTYETGTWRWHMANVKAFVQTYIVTILLVMSGALGLGAYMFYLQQNYQDPLYFLHVQSEFGAGRQENLVIYPQVVWRYVKILLTYRPFDWKYFALVQEAVVGTVGLMALIASFKWVRPSIVTFSLLAFLLPPLTGNFSSMSRYVLVCLAYFIAAGILLHRYPQHRWWYFGLSLAILCINTVLFIQGYWVA